MSNSFFEPIIPQIESALDFIFPNIALATLSDASIVKLAEIGIDELGTEIAKAEDQQAGAFLAGNPDNERVFKDKVRILSRDVRLLRIISRS